MDELIEERARPGSPAPLPLRESVSSASPLPGSRPQRPANAALRVFANGFLIAFAIDAVFVLTSSLLAGSGASWLVSARVAFTALLTFASLPLFVMLGIHPGLRWRIFLPPCLFLSWIALGAMPLPIWFEPLEAQRAAGALEAVLAVLAFVLSRQSNRAGGGGWLLDDDALRGPSFSGRIAVRFTALNLLVILPASLLYLGFAAAAGVGHLSAGFVAIRADGIHLSQREYTRGGQTIQLVAMMHIGDPSFYRELLAALPQDGAITLAEGVTDESGLMSAGFSYGNVASSLGLIEQPDFATNDREIRYADVDVSSFSPDTLRFLAGVGRVFGASSLADAIIAYAELSDMDSATAARTMTALRYDLIERRNQHLLAELERSLRDYDVIVVPWGALHLPGIESEVLAMGFVQQSEVDRRVVRW